MTNPLAVPVERGNAITAIAALILGISAVSFAAIFIRLSEQELGPYATIAHRFWICTLTLGLWIGFQRFQNRGLEQPQPLTRQDVALLIFAGSITGLDLCLWALSLSLTSVANAAVLGNLAPLFTALGSWLLWKQGVDVRYLVGLVVALGGALTIGMSDFQLGHWQGDAIALLSAVFFSVYLLSLERLRSRLSTTTVLLCCSMSAAVISTAIALCFEDRFFPVSEQGWLAVLGLALVSQTLGQSMVTFSLNRLSSGIVAIAFLLEPVIAAIIAWILFAETLSPLNEIGFALVILGVYVSLSSPSAVKPSIEEG